VFAVCLKKGGMFALRLEGFTLVAGISVRSNPDAEKWKLMWASTKCLRLFGFFIP